MNSRNGHHRMEGTGRMNERDDILDFPGADELIAAGAVAPPRADQLTSVRDRMARLAERETTNTRAALAQDAVLPPAVARRDGPTAYLAPPRTPRVVGGVEHGPGGTEPSGSGGRRSRGPRRRRLLVAGAAVAVLAAGAIAYPVLDVGGEPASTASAATRFLNEMAEVSTEAPAPRGKYWMSHYRAKDGRMTATVTVYSDRSGATWIRQPDGKVTRSGHNIADWPVGDRRLSWTDFDRLPADPEALKAYFSKDAAQRFDEIMSLLAESPASPRLRSALFQIVADTPGVTMTQNDKDSQGRPGTVINLPREVENPKTKLGAEPSATSRTTVYGPYYFIDPKTSRVLEQTSGLDATPLVRTTYLKVGWTDRIG
ncbi:hypothetical protein [Streptomyces coeruleorubidus]|uniref:hypothetical protein n=1 Tax=Streptomyces coeruleorubidus TaxID=116188 RepID=UPI0033AF1781